MTTETSKDCWCRNDVPPPVGGTYEIKGKWEQTGELKSYLTGPTTTATSAIIFIYDAFGVSPQCLQGADRLSQHLPNTLILMPDFFKGEGLDVAIHAVDPYLPEKVEARKGFMSTQAAFPPNIKALVELVPTIRQLFPTVQKVGCFGLCWGGKLSVLGSMGSGSPFAVSGQGHPGGMTADDARMLEIPHICLPSKDEPVEGVEDYKTVLLRERKEMGNVVELYADLEDSENRRQYERAYLQVGEFFAKHLQ